MTNSPNFGKIFFVLGIGLSATLLVACESQIGGKGVDGNSTQKLGQVVTQTKEEEKNVKPVNLVKEKRNMAGTMKFSLYSSRKGDCVNEFLDRVGPLYCRLVVTDLKNDKTVLDLNSLNLGVFSNGKEEFAAPEDWNDNDSLYIKAGFGDAGNFSETGFKLLVATKELEKLYQLSSEGGGTLLDFNGGKYLFDFSGGKFMTSVYKVNSDVLGTDKLYNFADNNTPVLKTALVKKMKDIEGYDAVGYVVGRGVVLMNSQTGKQMSFDLGDK